MSLHDTSGSRNIRNSEINSERLWMFLDKIEYEARRAFAIYNGFASPHEGYAVIKEEVDEFWDDIKDDKYSHASEEAMKIAAMCVQFALQYSDTDNLDELLNEKR